MVVNRIFAFVVPIAIGALLGAIIGGIVTGSDDYIVGWSIGGPILITAIIFIAAMRSARKNDKAKAPKPVGINETLTAGGPKFSVLNGETAAAPSTGAVLNGEPIDGVDTTKMPRPSGRPVRLRRGIAVALVAGGAALSLIPAYTMVGWIANDIVHGHPFDGRDMRTGLHQNDAMNQIADVVGSNDIVRVNFYADYIIVEARTSPRSTTVDTYMWRGGKAFRAGPGGFESELSDELFDASKVDFSIIPELIKIAKRDSGLNDADDFYPGVARDNGVDGLGDPVISVSLSNDYFDAYYTFSLDGEIIDKSGSAFE